MSPKQSFEIAISVDIDMVIKTNDRDLYERPLDFDAFAIFVFCQGITTIMQCPPPRLPFSLAKSSELGPFDLITHVTQMVFVLDHLG